MVDRFNGRIAEVRQTTRFRSGEQFSETLHRSVRLDNQQIPQRALGHVAPIQALKQWHEREPELFSKRPYHLTGLDT